MLEQHHNEPPADDELLTAELLAIDHHAIVPVNRDVTDAALRAQLVAEQLAPFRDELLAIYGSERIRCLDRLAVVARAALLVDATYRAADEVPDERAMTAELLRERDFLRAATQMLIDRGAVDRRALRAQSTRFSRPSLCLDVLQLVAILEDHCVPEGVGGITCSELGRAETHVNDLLVAIAARESGTPTPLADLRARAFTLLVTTYDEVRRLLPYLRWKEGDADLLAPSLWDNPGPKKKSRLGRNARKLVR